MFPRSEAISYHSLSLEDLVLDIFVSQKVGFGKYTMTSSSNFGIVIHFYFEKNLLFLYYLRYFYSY